jgi:hypothetical protein
LSEVVTLTKQLVYKPGSVGLCNKSGRSFLYRHSHPYRLAAYPRRLVRGERLSPHAWPCSSWGLPCRPCHHERGELLPHRFTLAVPKEGGLFSVALSVAGNSRRPRPGVTWQPVHRSPDFPRAGTNTCARSPDQLLPKYKPKSTIRRGSGGWPRLSILTNEV